MRDDIQSKNHSGSTMLTAVKKSRVWSSEYIIENSDYHCIGEVK